MSSGEGAVVEVDLRMQFKGNEMSILLSQCPGKERGLGVEVLFSMEV